MAIGVVLSFGLNFHETPNGKIIDGLARGDRFDILEERSALRVKKWLRTRWRGQPGWVAEFDGVTGARLVQREEAPVAAPKPIPQPPAKPAKPAPAPRPVAKPYPPPPLPQPTAKPKSNEWPRILLWGIATVVIVVVFTLWLNGWL